MNPVLNNNQFTQRDVERVQQLSVEQQLELVAASRGGSLENKLTGAAIAVILSRIVQLSKEDQRSLWECLKDFSTIRTREDAVETMETVLEILDPVDSDTKLVGIDESGSKGVSEEKCDGWLAYVSNAIRQLREEKQMTQAQLAEATGLPQSHISRLERGVHSPSHKTLKKLAEVYGVDVNKLDPSL